MKRAAWLGWGVIAVVVSIGGCTSILGGFADTSGGSGGAGTGGAGSSGQPSGSGSQSNGTGASSSTHTGSTSNTGSTSSNTGPSSSASAGGGGASSSSATTTSSSTGSGGSCTTKDDCGTPPGQCVNWKCVSGACQHENAPNTQSCSAPPYHLCDGSGQCSNECNVDGDCGNGNTCNSHNCIGPCFNSQQDGAETDVDCGGGNCPKCLLGKRCSQGADCFTNFCVGSVKTCQTCDTNTQNCGAGLFCEQPPAGPLTCVPVKNNGSPCNANFECGSTFCADGVCCDSSCDQFPCMSCSGADTGAADGLCRGALNGKNPRSLCVDDRAAGGCHLAQCKLGACEIAVNQACGPDGCFDQFTLVYSGVCDTAGNCNGAGGISCNPYICDQTQQNCLGSCTSDTDCVPDAYCETTGTNKGCHPKGDVGAPCANTNQCKSTVGLACVDGVCCTSSACQVCFACNIPGSEGDCKPVINRPDNPECSGSQSCDNATPPRCLSANGVTCVNGSECQSHNCVGTIPNKVCKCTTTPSSCPLGQSCKVGGSLDGMCQ